MGRAATVAIHPAGAADAPALHAMIRALAEFEKLAHLCTGTEQDLREALAGRPPAVEALMARIDGEPVGFALFFHTFSTFLARRGLWLEDLFVLDAHRRRGCGRLLLERVAQVAVARGCGRLEWSVLDWNAPALGFYRKLGAAALDQWTIHRVTGKTLRALAGAPG